MSTKLEIYRERQRQKKEKVGDRPAKLNVKKSDRELQQKIKNNRDFLVGRTTWKFCSEGEKMRNASGHQVKMSGSKKKWTSSTTFPQKNV